ncbi:hypothetical protein TNCV_2932581 [Trichonephila clavipes]|nr:hypothetical protein TNCV_2932581 [Trichonephila clavipes]
MDKPDVDNELWRPWARRPVCVLACDAQIGRGRPRDFCDLPRRDEGRVVNTPLVFKRVLFGERKETRDGKREEKESGERERSRPWMEKRA